MKKIIFSLVLLIAIFINSFALAQCEIPKHKKICFRWLLKEYACKIVGSQLAAKNNTQNYYDIDGLRKSIYNKVINSKLYYIEYVNFINENPRLSAVYAELNRLIQKKIKYDALDKANPILIKPAMIGRNANYKLTFNDKILHSFSPPPMRKDNLFFENKEESNVFRTTAAQEMAYAIFENSENWINDIKSLQEYGPLIVTRLETLLTGNDDGLDFDNVDDLLILYCGFKVALENPASYSKPIDQIHFSNTKYIDLALKIYERAVLPKYKAFIILRIISIHQCNYPKPNNKKALEFALKAKNDLYNFVDTETKINFLYLIAYNACCCVAQPPSWNINQKYYQICLDHYTAMLDILKPMLNSRALSQEKIKEFIIKAFYDISIAPCVGLVTLYALSKNFPEAIKSLDIVISMTSPGEDVHDSAVKYREMLLNYIKPLEISDIKFLSSNGQEVKWGEILEINQEYTIQAITKVPVSEPSIKINYSSNYGNGNWDLKKLQNNDTTYQATVKIDSSIIGLNPDNKWRFVAFDYLPDAQSNLGDSKLFIEKAKNQLGYIDGGYFQASSSGIPNEVKEDFSNPVLPITKEAFVAAGVEYLKIEAGNIKKIIPFKNQANMLYYSGHGSSSDGSLVANVAFNPIDIQNNEWANLRVIIIAGCSVLSLDNQLQTPGGGYPKDPGIKWVDLGKRSNLKYFLGYRKTAPRDNQPTGNTTVPASKIICNNFFKKLQDTTTGLRMAWCSDWMGANRNKNGWNACAIEVGIDNNSTNKYHYWIKTFWYGVPDHDEIIKTF